MDNSENYSYVDKFILVFQHNPTPMFITTFPDLLLLEINHAAQALLGYSEEELLGADITNLKLFVDPLQPQQIVSLFTSVDTLTNYELELFTQNGQIITVQISISPLKFANEQLLLVSLIDITEKKINDHEKQTLITYHENLEKIEQAIRQAHDMDDMMAKTLACMLDIFQSDRAWLVFPCDPKAPTWRAIMEQTRQEFPGAFALNVDMPMIPELQEVYEAALQSEEPVVFAPYANHKMPRQTGEAFSIKSGICMAIFPKDSAPWCLGLHQCKEQYYWATNEIYLFKEIGRRITDSLSSLLFMRKLKNSQALLSATLHSMDDVIFVLNKDGYFIDLFQNTTAKFLSFPLSLHIGKHYSVILPDLIVPRISAAIAAIRDTHEVQQLDYEIPTKDDTRTYSAKITARMNEQGDFNGVTIVSRDITERARTKLELQTYKNHLEELVEQRTYALQSAYEDMESFSYSVSHDLRAPLRAITGFANILNEDYGQLFDQQGKQTLERINTNIKKMGQLIDDLLAYSRVNCSSPDVTKINITELCHTLANELNDTDRRIEFIIQEMPQVLGDKTMIRQLFTNLIDNAIKYTRPKTDAQIEVGSELRDRQTVYYIKDNGVGFNMAYATKLFTIFQRLHSPKDFEGTGVGLAIVKRIIQKHEGTIWADAQPNQGAIFYFTLPVNA